MTLISYSLSGYGFFLPFDDVSFKAHRALCRKKNNLRDEIKVTYFGVFHSYFFYCAPFKERQKKTFHLTFDRQAQYVYRWDGIGERYNLCIGVVEFRGHFRLVT